MVFFYVPNYFSTKEWYSLCSPRHGVELVIDTTLIHSLDIATYKTCADLTAVLSIETRKTHLEQLEAHIFPTVSDTGESDSTERDTG